VNRIESAKESIGEKIDQVSELAHTATERIGEHVDRVGDRIGEHVDKLGERVDRVTDKIGEHVERAGERLDRVGDKIGEHIDRAGDAISDAWEDLSDWTSEQADAIRASAREVLNDAMGSIRRNPAFQQLSQIKDNMAHAVRMITDPNGSRSAMQDLASDHVVTSNGRELSVADGDRVTPMMIIGAIGFGLFNGLLAGLGDVFRDAASHPSCETYGTDVALSFSELGKAVARASTAIFTYVCFFYFFFYFFFFFF
jgi:hypothetical protein